MPQKMTFERTVQLLTVNWQDNEITIERNKRNTSNICILESLLKINTNLHSPY